jgi:hypothetical protein
VALVGLEETQLRSRHNGSIFMQRYFFDIRDGDGLALSASDAAWTGTKKK